MSYATDNSAYSTSASRIPLFPPIESFLEKTNLITCNSRK